MCCSTICKILWAKAFRILAVVLIGIYLQCLCNERLGYGCELELRQVHITRDDDGRCGHVLFCNTPYTCRR